MKTKKQLSELNKKELIKLHTILHNEWNKIKNGITSDSTINELWESHTKIVYAMKLKNIKHIANMDSLDTIEQMSAQKTSKLKPKNFIYADLAKLSNPLPEKYYKRPVSSSGWAQFHWQGMDKKGGNLSGKSVTCNINLKDEKTLIQITLAADVETLMNCISGYPDIETNDPKNLLGTIKLSELKKQRKKMQKENSWEINNTSYWIPPGKVGSTWSYIQLIDNFKFKTGVQREDLLEVFLQGKHFNGRYVLSMIKNITNPKKTQWKLSKPKNQMPLDPYDFNDNGFKLQFEPEKKQSKQTKTIKKPQLSEEKIELIKEMTLSGKFRRDIAIKLNCSKSTIYRYQKQLKLR